MTLNQLIYFHTISETENMRKASELLFVSQPSLSTSMQSLENELGVLLFERKGHRIRLTEAGRQFKRHCEKILAEVDTAKEHMRRLSATHEHTITLGCIEPLLHTYLPKKMGDFLKQSGEEATEFEIITDTSPNLIHQLKAGRLDLILCTESEDPELEEECLFDDEIVLICNSRKSGKEAGTYQMMGNARYFETSPFLWEEIALVPMLGYPKGTAMDEMLSGIWLAHGINPAYRYRMPNEISIAAMVANGFDFAMIPLIPMLSRFDVDIYPLPEAGYRRKICLAWDPTHETGAASTRFRDNVMEEIQRRK